MSLAIFTFVAGITPGPNNMMLMASGLNHGIRKSIPHYLGICLGFPIMVAVVGFGSGAIFAKYPSMYLFLKVFGILYLLFLAWKIANAGRIHTSKKMSNPFSFFQAAVFQWLNPKAWVIAISALAAFSSKEHFYTSVSTVILAYLITGLVCMALWLKLGHSLRHFLHTTKRINVFNMTMAALLVISIVPIAFQEFIVE